ncbi:hypothetical protein Tco_1534616 [Tanacetum coccineum]
MQPVALPSPNYVPGPKHLPSPDYVLGPEHPPSPVEPLPVDASPTALSPGYVADSDSDKDLEGYPEEGHANYPADGGDDDEPSDDDDDVTDDKDEEPFEEEDDDKEEEEYLALADPSVVPVVDHVPSTRDTEAYEMDEFAPTPRSPQTKYATAPAPPSPLSPWSPPLPQIPSPPLQPTPSSLHFPPHVPTSLPLPLSSLPLLPVLLFIPPPVDRREDIPKAELPPHKRLCPTDHTSRYEVEESSTATPRPTGGHRADYGFIGTTDAEVRCRRAEEVSYDIRDVWVDPTETVKERVDGLVEDRQLHYETARLLDREAHVSREAWAHFVRLSLAVSSLQGQLLAALGQIQALQARD